MAFTKLERSDYDNRNNLRWNIDLKRTSISETIWGCDAHSSLTCPLFLILRVETKIFGDVLFTLWILCWISCFDANAKLAHCHWLRHFLRHQRHDVFRKRRYKQTHVFKLWLYSTEDHAEKCSKEKRRIKETNPLNSSGAPGQSHRFTQSLIGGFSAQSFTFQSSLPGTPGTLLYRGGKFKLSQSS